MSANEALDACAGCPAEQGRNGAVVEIRECGCALCQCCWAFSMYEGKCTPSYCVVCASPDDWHGHMSHGEERT
jgi:hypothetical protein